MPLRQRVSNRWLFRHGSGVGQWPRAARKMHRASVRERMGSVFGSDTSTASEDGFGDDAVQPEDTATAAATPAASSPALGPTDAHFMTQAAINMKKVVELKAACVERNLLQSGNKRHLASVSAPSALRKYTMEPTAAARRITC